MLRVLRTTMVSSVTARTLQNAAGQHTVSIPRATTLLRSCAKTRTINNRGFTSAIPASTGPAAGLFGSKALVGLAIGGAAAATVLYYNHVQGSTVSASHKPGALSICSSPDRDIATVTFRLPDKKYSRVFLSLNHCRTSGQDCVNFFVNGQPLRLGCTESPVYDYGEQVYRIPRQMCLPGRENVVTMRLAQPHSGQYWLLDASLDAYEQGPVLILHHGAQTGKLVM